MAKKKPVLDMFAKTAQPDQEDAADPIAAKGVGLKESEWAEIERLAGELGTNRHALAVVLLRYGLAHLKAGKIPTRTQKTLDL